MNVPRLLLGGIVVTGGLIGAAVLTAIVIVDQAMKRNGWN